MKRFTFSHKERIHNHTEFISVYKKGDKKESAHFKISLLQNKLSWRRLGVTVSKRVGKSVQRNYIKRRLREYFRVHKYYLPESCDIVITAKKGAHRLTYHQMCCELNGIFGRDSVDPSEEHCLRRNR